GERGTGDVATLDSWAWATASGLVKHVARPGVFNEAMMELGATVCLPAPNQPRCAECPFARWCVAKQQGTQREIPGAEKRGEQKGGHHYAVVVRLKPPGSRVLLEQRPARGMWSNMWQVPTIEAGTPLSDAQLRRKLPVRVNGLRKRESFVHNTTHRRITFH